MERFSYQGLWAFLIIAYCLFSWERGFSTGNSGTEEPSMLHYEQTMSARLCIHKGIEYNSGDVIQPNCSTRCTCQERQFICKTQKCLIDGPHCYGWGDPHYRSFDYRSFDFQGDCEYILTQPCNNNNFIVAVLNRAINSHVSVTSRVRVIVPNKGLEIVLGRGGGGTITINGVMQANDGDRVVYRSSGIQVLRTGGRPYILLTIEQPLGISWDGSHRVDVTASKEWQSKLCGLCGNYNNDRNDDFMLPNGTITTSANEFGSSWLYTKSHPTCGELSSPSTCPNDVMTTAQSKCNELSNSVFRVCNSVVDPTIYIKDCMLDYCQCSEEDKEDCYCNSLSTYAADCASNGVVIPNWRNSFCAIECPGGMVYQQCGPVCPQTYDNQHCSAGCAEGCFCPDGMILSNNKCINLTDCQVVNCKHPGVPANGKVNLTNSTLGSTVTYICDIPFVLCGDDTRTCLPTGVWSGAAPSCNLIRSVVTVKRTTYTVKESDGFVDVTILVDTPNCHAIAVIIQPKEQTPVDASVNDFDSTPIRVTILPGDTDVTVSIPIVNDTIVEGEESFDVVIEASGIGVAVGYSRQAEVTIADKMSLPRITRQPDDVNVTTLCNSASFVCTAHGFGLRKIVWKRVNYTLPVTADVTEEKSFNELSSTLTISEIFGYYSGQYYCIVENEAEKVTSRIVNLCVKTIRHPEIITSLENITVLPYQDYNLSCLALSLGVLTYDWNRHGGNLSQNAVKSFIYEDFFNPLGSEATLVYNLALPNIQPSDEGWYCCVATNEGGSTTKCIWLEVNTLPNITMQPVSTTFKTGDINVIAMSCKTVGVTHLYFQWERYHSLDNSWIRPSHRAVNITSPHLIFKYITEEDEGVYRCIVTSDDGSVVSDNATVHVYGPPIITFISNHTVSLEGDKVKLLCIAINDAHANYSIQINWYKGNVLIVPNGKRILLYNETTKDSKQLKSTLILDPINSTDDGVYTCQAVNHPDLHSESQANLTVEYAPRVSIVNQSPYVINVGSIATVYCRASGKPIPTVQWYKDSLAVNPVASLYQQAFLIPTDAPHTTVYTCVGRNYAGGKIHMKSANITVTVKAVAACYPLLEAPKNGERFIIPGNGFAKYISFSCNPNYVLKGKTLATCNNGKWSSSTPTCTPL